MACSSSIGSEIYASPSRQMSASVIRCGPVTAPHGECHVSATLWGSEKFTLVTTEGSVLASGVLVSTICEEEISLGIKVDDIVPGWKAKHPYGNPAPLRETSGQALGLLKMEVDDQKSVSVNGA